MFEYSTSDTVIPTLSFTKAELAYAIFVLMKDLSVTDTTTKIEMVEVRHYLNQIGDKVLMSTHDGSLKNSISESIGLETKKEDGNLKEEKNKMPSIEELKKQFPTLSEEEIKEVLNTVRIEQQIAAKEGEKKDDIPEKSSFFAKPKIPHEGSEMVSHETNENGPTAAMTVDRDKETSEKFARLLGAF